MRGYSYPLCLLSAVLIFTCATAHADVVVIGTQTDTSPIAFSELGTFVDAGNFNGPNTVRGTNVFAPKTLVGTPPAQVFPGSNGVSVTLAASIGVLAAADIRQGSFTDDLYFTEIYTFTQAANEILSISGLNPLKTYQIQFPHGESRPIPYHGTQTFTDGSGDTSLLEFGGPNFDPYSLITVQVSNTTSLSYAMPPSDNPPGFRGASMNGYTIRDVTNIVPVPTPAALPGGLALLVGIGAVKFFRSRAIGDGNVA